MRPSCSLADFLRSVLARFSYNDNPICVHILQSIIFHKALYGTSENTWAWRHRLDRLFSPILDPFGMPLQSLYSKGART